jgi:hypothetical protein
MATKKLKVVDTALKEKSGKIDKAPSVKYAHDDIKAKVGKKETKGAKHEFVLSDGEVVNRKKAAKVAEAAGEVKPGIKKLHSHQLRKGLGVKRIKNPK